MGKISALAALTTPATDDLLVTVDVHDTTMAATGTDKKITVGNLLYPAAAVQALSNNSTITAGYSGMLPVTETGNVTGIILAPPTGAVSTEVTVLNRSAFTITFAAAGTSHVAGGASNVIPALGASSLVYDPGTSLWYPAGSAGVSLDSTASDFQPDGVAAAGSTGKASDAGHVHPLEPWQFLPESYGATGNGKVIGDVVLNATTTITSASAGFTSGDVGKHIMIHGALGTTSGPLITTISSFTNSTTVVLASGATVSGSSYPAVYGTDDTAAIQSAVTAAGNYATANDYYGEVIFGPKIYVLSAGPTQQGNGSTTVTSNAQITLPWPNPANTTQKLVIALTGSAGGGYLQYWNSLIPNVAGTSLVSMTTAPAPYSATFGMQSVIGGPTGSAGFGGSPAYANTKAVIRGISVWCPIYTNLVAFDLGYISSMRVEQCAAHIFAPTGGNASSILPLLNNISATALANAVSIGIRTPVTSNNLDISIDGMAVEGYEIAYLVFDHLDARRLNAIYNDVCMKFDGGMGASGTSHGIFVHSIGAEAYNGGFRAVGGNVHVNINWDAECNAAPAYDFSDGGNVRGIFRFRDVTNVRFPTVSGGGKIKVICEELGPGNWAGAPAAPASTVSQQNTAWRDAWITLSATTGITVITVDGVTTGLTAGNAVATMIRVPSGKSYAVTYTGTLTTKWWLD